MNWWSLLRERYAGTWRWGGGGRGSSWRSLAAGEGTTRQGPLWHADGIFFFFFYNCCQPHLYILLSSYRCCAVFSAASPAQPGGTFTTVLYGQIICNIKALMMTMELLLLQLWDCNALTNRRQRYMATHTVAQKRLLLCHFWHYRTVFLLLLTQ